MAGVGVGECGAAVECCLKINLISSNQSTGTADIFIHKLSTNFSAASPVDSLPAKIHPVKSTRKKNVDPFFEASNIFN